MPSFALRSARTWPFVLMLALAGCATTIQTQGYRADPSSQAAARTTPASTIEIWYSVPQRRYETLGTLSVRKYKPGWSDPTVSDSLPELREGARRLGGDAVILRSQRSLNDRFITIEGEVVRWR